MLAALMTPLAWMRLGLLGAVLALGAYVWHSHGATEYKRGKAEVQKSWDADTEARRMAALKAIEQNRVDAAITADAQKESLHVAQLAQAHHDADLIAAARSSERLLHAFAAATACGGPPAGDPAAVSGSPPAQAPADLRTDVLRRLSEAAGGASDYADSLAIALDKCNADYEALRLTPPK